MRFFYCPKLDFYFSPFWQLTDCIMLPASVLPSQLHCRGICLPSSLSGYITTSMLSLLRRRHLPPSQSPSHTSALSRPSPSAPGCVQRRTVCVARQAPYDLLVRGILIAHRLVRHALPPPTMPAPAIASVSIFPRERRLYARALAAAICRRCREGNCSRLGKAGLCISAYRHHAVRVYRGDVRTAALPRHVLHRFHRIAPHAELYAALSRPRLSLTAHRRTPSCCSQPGLSSPLSRLSLTGRHSRRRSQRLLCVYVTFAAVRTPLEFMPA